MTLILGGSEGTRGGLEEYCQRLHALLSANSPSKPVWLFTNTSFTSLGVRAAVLFWKALFNSIPALRESRLVWLQCGNALDFVVLLLIRLVYDGPLLCTLHCGSRWRYMRYWVGRHLAARALRNATLVCVLSHSQRDDCNRIGITNVTRIPTLLPEWIRTPKVNQRQDGRAGVAVIGRLVPEKGIEDAIDAFRLLKARGSPEQLHLVGAASPDYEQVLRRRAAQLGLENELVWHGHLGGTTLADALGRIRVVLHPSRVDAYPLTVLEALASGASVVAYDLPGVLEMRSFGVTCVPLGDVSALADAASFPLPARPELVAVAFSFTSVWRDYEKLLPV